MTKSKQNKFLMNLLKFTAPILGSFFLMLSQGVPLDKAWPIALVALWGALADFFSKVVK